MNRWGWGLLVVVLACLPILARRSTSPALLRDTDTSELLKAVRLRHSPLSWFLGDWPLQNHFYRPVVAISFEVDSAVYGDRAAGYGLTNSLLCVGCLLALFWFCAELTGSLSLSLIAAFVFALWNIDSGAVVAPGAAWASGGIASMGLIRHGLRVRHWLPASLCLAFLSYELGGIAALSFRMSWWLPGRTASLMALFALISLASYARLERIGPDRMPPREPTATDLPATRTSGAPSQATGREWLWALLSLACLALALASYEQAVVLPVALLGVGLLFQLGGHRIRWPWHAASWALLLLYLAIRKLVLPAGVSGYQLQQFRHGVTVAWSIARYVFPASFDARDLLFGGLSGALLLSLEPLRQAWAVSANVVAYLQIRRRLWVGLCAYALSVGSFLPMAWLKPFEHYHYLPMAFRALFVAVLAAVCFDLSVTAVSPRARQAPPRPSPAPGSLLRP